MNAEFDYILNSNIPNSWSSSFESLKKGNFLEESLDSEIGKQIVLLTLTPHLECLEDLSLKIRNQISSYLDHETKSKNEVQLEILVLGISCLNGFLQASWTGPNFTLSELEKLNQIESRLTRKASLSLLSEDNEEVYPLTPSPILLLIAKIILVGSADILKDLKTVEWWKCRCCFIHQRILANPTQTLLDTMLESIEQTRSKLPPLTDDSKNLHVKLFLEEGLIHSYHRHDKRAFQSFTSASETSKFQWSMSGALGKRTRYQTFDVAQLVVVAESASTYNDLGIDEKQTESSTHNIPKALPLNDDTLLEKIGFIKLDDEDCNNVSKQGSLRILDQCILLAFCLSVKNANPAHGLTEAEMLPYVTRVLEDPNNWMVHTMGLLLRSRLESQKSRTVERSVLQIQALVDQIPERDPSSIERLSYFFNLLVPSKWDLEVNLCFQFSKDLGIPLDVKLQVECAIESESVVLP